MENKEVSTTSQSVQELLKSKIEELTDEKNDFIHLYVSVAMILCVILVLILLIFSNTITNKMCSNENSTSVLWMIAILVFVGLIWLVVRSYVQLKRYRKCIRKLDTLSLEITIKNEIFVDKIKEEKLCDKIRNIIKILDV